MNSSATNNVVVSSLDAKVWKPTGNIFLSTLRKFSGTTTTTKKRGAAMGNWISYDVAGSKSVKAAEEKTMAPSFTLVTQNVWFDGRTSRWRFPVLLENLQRLDADVFCLQECTPAFLRLLSDAPWVQENYIMSDISGTPLMTWYGVAILAKRTRPDVTVSKMTKMEYSQTRMGRSLVVAHLLVQGVGVVVGTSHFESYDEDEPVRKIQFTEATAHLVNEIGGGGGSTAAAGAGAAPAIAFLCGDTNIAHDERETPYLLEGLGWTDAWIVAEKDGMDPVTKDGVTYGVYQPGEIRPKKRIDRVMFRSTAAAANKKRITVTDLRYFGYEPFDLDEVQCRVYPSDHLGVFAKFSWE
ncbi:Endonuclease/exonuclease/phosphatase [Powellomyces hirtus]|nr:Endonuclease/exonuclease/phosphatase [Powellomyces hirtus]